MRVRLPGPSQTAGPQGRRAAGPQEEETVILATLERTPDTKAGVR
ncbi:hypothetical protein [Streptomyces canus]|nr:hypothetical protein [Streptomyces canus]